MTCIIGIIEKNTVYIGGDSASISESSISYRKDPKVFKRGPFIYGFTTSFRMGQLIMHGDKLKIREQRGDEDIYAYMITVFIDAIRKLFNSGGYMQKENDQEKGGTFLVGYKGRLFTIHDDFQVAEQLNEYDSIGCGCDLALGSLFTSKDLPVKKRIKTALKAAEKFSSAVSRPFKIIKIKK